MKKWLSSLCLLPIVCALLIAGCGNVDWFPDAVDSTTNNGSNNNGGSTDNGNNGGDTTATAFETQCGVAPATVVTSNSILLPVVSGQQQLSVALFGAGSKYSVDGGEFKSAAAQLPTGSKTIRVQHTSAAAGAASTVVTTTLVVSGTTFTFKSDTTNGACTP